LLYLLVLLSCVSARLLLGFCQYFKVFCVA